MALCFGDDMTEKRCTKCGETKAVTEFRKDANGRDGLRAQCKACGRAYSKAYCETNPDKIKAYSKACYNADPEKHRARRRAYYKVNSERERAYQKAEYAADPEKFCARAKAYRMAYPEKHRSVVKAYRIAHPEKVSATNKAYRGAHPEKTREWNTKRRALHAGAAGYATTEQRAARWDYYGGKCYICGKDAEAMDHVKPLDKGGGNWPANLRPICGWCNSSKRARWPFDIGKARMMRGNGHESL